MQLIVKDVDITASDQSIRLCKYSDYAGGHADALQIIFNDTYDLWRKWGLVKGDKIRISNNGIDTGDMYVSKIGIDTGYYAVKALSTPAKSLNESSSTRENIRLTEILREVSGELGFQLKTYGITDQLYIYVERINQNPIAYLEQILMREGYLQKIFNNTLIVYSEKLLEHAEPNFPITIDNFINKPSFKTSDSDILASVENIYQHEKGLIKSYASSGLSGKNKKFNFSVTSMGEGERFCKNILRYYNKNEFTGEGILSESKITGGVTINLDGDFADWSGKNFVYEVNHDMLFDRQTIKFRKAINGDY
jgi:hypothetical protein